MCDKCMNKGSAKCQSCTVSYYNGVRQGLPSNYEANPVREKMATEQRLIDANALKKAIRAESWKQERKVQLTLDFIDIIVDEQPTVDAVEVVRCKDCKHYDNSEGICWCKLNSKFFPGGFDWHGFPKDGFCSYGERRTGNA